MSGLFPHNLHIHEKTQFAAREQKMKCLPQLLVLGVHVHQQTPRAEERTLHALGEDALEMQRIRLKALCLQMPQGLGSDQIPASPTAVLLEELKFLCLWADNISGPRASGYKASCSFSGRPGRVQPNFLPLPSLPQPAN